MKIKTLSIAAAIIAVTTGFAWASGNWSNARSKADEYKRKAADLSHQVPAETKRIVRAVCEASEDSRDREGLSAASSARGAISDKYRDLERLEHDAMAQLDQVVSDASLKSSHHDAESLKSDIRSSWDKLGQLTQDLRNGRAPVVDYMLSHGQSARRDHMGRCDVRDFSLGGNRATCLIAHGDTCSVVELSADSSRAVSAAHDRAERWRSQLDNELKRSDSDVVKRLISARSEFARCKRFVPSVHCYKLCPDVDDSGRFHESSASWRTDC
jgi:hypothetical protein